MLVIASHLGALLACMIDTICSSSHRLHCSVRCNMKSHNPHEEKALSGLACAGKADGPGTIVLLHVLLLKRGGRG